MLIEPIKTQGGVDECLDNFDINNSYGKRALSCLVDDLRYYFCCTQRGW